MDDLFEEDSADMSIADIYKQLILHKEVIVTIGTDQVDSLRKGLANYKSRQNAKLKSANLPPDPDTLRYNIYEVEGSMPSLSKVHIVLSRKTSLTVFAMEIPDPEI